MLLLWCSRGTDGWNTAGKRSIACFRAAISEAENNLTHGKTANCGNIARKNELKKVLSTTAVTAPTVLTLTLALLTSPAAPAAAEQVTTTRSHPFYVAGKGFTPAGGLKAGDRIESHDGPELVVRKIEWHRRVEGYAVYNAVVEDDHSYFVGSLAGGAWVHNGEEQCAGVLLPDFFGQPISEVESTLGGAGFAERPANPSATSAYRYFNHPDGSMVAIDPTTKSVKVYGPRCQWPFKSDPFSAI